MKKKGTLKTKKISLSKVCTKKDSVHARNDLLGAWLNNRPVALFTTLKFTGSLHGVEGHILVTGIFFRIQQDQIIVMLHKASMPKWFQSTATALSLFT